VVKYCTPVRLSTGLGSRSCVSTGAGTLRVPRCIGKWWGDGLRASRCDMRQPGHPHVSSSVLGFRCGAPISICAKQRSQPLRLPRAT
jgi:hypothetical protein